MSLIAAFDLSMNSTGVCIIDIDKSTPVHYESITSDLEGISRLNYNYSRYLNIFASYKDIKWIAFEAQNPQMRFSYNAGSILSLAENAGAFKLAICHGTPHLSDMSLVLGIPAQDIKKYATNNGKATKEEMIAAVNGNHIKSIRRDIPEHSVNDVCDAYHLAMMTKDLILNNQDYSTYIVEDRRVLSVNT